MLEKKTSEKKKKTARLLRAEKRNFSPKLTEKLYLFLKILVADV